MSSRGVQNVHPPMSLNPLALFPIPQLQHQITRPHTPDARTHIAIQLVDRRLGVLQGQLELLILVLRLVQLRLAVLLLVVVGGLLFREVAHHVVDHHNNLSGQRSVRTNSLARPQELCDAREPA